MPSCVYVILKKRSNRFRSLDAMNQSGSSSPKDWSLTANKYCTIPNSRVYLLFISKKYFMKGKNASTERGVKGNL